MISKKNNCILPILILTFLCFFRVQSYSQNEEQNFIKNNSEFYDQIYVDSIYAQVRELIIYNDDYNKGQKIISEGLSYCTNNQYDFAKFSFMQGKLYLSKGQNEEFINQFNQIIQNRPDSLNKKHKNLIALSHYNLASFFSDTDVESKMNNHCKEALNFFDKTDFDNIHHIYSIQADYYYYKEDDDLYKYSFKIFLNSIKHYIYTFNNFPTLEEKNLVYSNFSISLNVLARYYEYINDFKNSLIFYEKVLFIVMKYTNNKESIIMSKFNLAYINFFLKNYDQTEILAKNILTDNNNLEIPDIDIIMGSLTLLGDIRFQRKDYFQAKIYYDEAMLKAIELLPKNHPDIKHNHERLAVINYALSNYELAVKHYEEARSLTLNKEGINYLNYTIGIAGSYQYIDKKKSYKYYLNALKISKNINGIRKIDSEANIYYNLAILEKNDFKSSIIKHNLARDLYKKSPNDHSESSLNLICLAEAHKKDKQTYVNYLDEAILSTLRKKNNYSRNEIPKYDDIVFPFQLIHCYKTLGQYYEENNELDTALIIYEKAKKVISIIKPMYKYDASKASLTQESLPIYNKIISLSYKKYKSSKEYKYFQQAYDSAEKSKSIHLIDALKDNFALNKVGVPDSLISIGKELKTEIDNLKENLKIELDKSEITTIKNDILKLSTKYNEYLIKIENQYPQYYNLKYSTKDVNLKELQSSIRKDEIIIQYNIQDSLLAILAITKNNESFLVKNISKKEIELKIQLYRESISNKNNGTINQLSVDLFIILFKDIIKSHPKKDKITIIPDGILSHLPFELLAPTLDSDSRMIYSKFISYNYTSYPIHIKRKIPKNNFIAIVPSYNNFPKLPYAKREVNEINQFFNGKILEKKEANIINFQKTSSTYKLIHFAGHAEINDTFPLQSRLIFSDIKDSIQSLYAHELYNMKINADMVALSACNSGVGKIKEGEGNISLARGFSYAGCPSTVTTLWPMTDEPTKDIMTAFYKNLEKGYSKSEALRKTKLDYLENGGPRIQDPIYWSGIVIIGSDYPIIQPSIFNSFNFSWILILLLIPIILLIIKKLKK